MKHTCIAEGPGVGIDTPRQDDVLLILDIIRQTT
jgi:hypothetical protein